jgi:hypothetical protein
MNFFMNQSAFFYRLSVEKIIIIDDNEIMKSSGSFDI